MPNSPRPKQPPASNVSRTARSPKRTPQASSKISPPSLVAVCERKRLFKTLDDASHRPIIFINAPAGAGKTTLVASYLEARKRPCVWLQIEADNADPASYVYYLRLAAQRIAPRRAAKLPLLTAEYQHGLPAFARNLFETLAHVLPEDAVLVLDNYQEVAADAALHGFLAEGLASLPPGMRLLCLSRHIPPAAFARRRAEGAVSLLEWDALRFTLDETAALARLRYGKRTALAAAELRRLHTRTHGWAAGIMLLLDTPTAASDSRIEQEDQTTFDYLAAEVFQRLEPATRELLPSLAIPSALSASMAAEMTGDLQAGQRLEELVRANCFTTRHVSAHYQFHPLFRNFLLNELRNSGSGADRRSLQRITAKLLVSEGRPEEAAQLFINATDWPGLAELIVRNAQGLLAQGRHETLATWLRALPTELRDADPWMLFFLGAARFPFNLGESEELFERAAERFCDAGNDMAGLVLAWSGVIQAIAMAWSDLTTLARWIDLAEREIVPKFAQLTPELQGRVIYGMFVALQFDQPQHSDMHKWAERLEAVVGQIADPGERLQLGTFLVLDYGHWAGDLHAADRLIRILRPQRVTSISPVARLHWYAMHAYTLVMTNTDAALGEVDEAVALVERHGLRFIDFLIYSAGVHVGLAFQDKDAASRYLDQAGRTTSMERPVEYVHYQLLCGRMERARGDLDAARRRAEWAIPIVKAKAGTFEISFTYIELAHCQRACGNHAEALANGEQALALAHSMRGHWVEYLAQACLAETALASGDAVRGLVALREAYRIARERGFRSLMWQDPKSMAYLCNQALEANIEPEHCRALIAAHRLVLPDDAVSAEHWSYPLKIRTLGTFDILRDGQPLRFEGKPQRKPLELLKVLIAFGGRDVRDERLSATLWPDAEGSAAQSAFTTTLARLRSLLAGGDTVVVQDGRVSLNPHYCWLDTWALETHIAAIERAPVIAGASVPVLALYRGAFLEHESDSAWVLPTRERQRSRFLRFLDHEARRLGTAGLREEAITLYLQGLEIDPLIESFYRGLMTTYGELGRKAEALASFERCRAILTKTLGIQPAAETFALAEKLRAA